MSYSAICAATSSTAGDTCPALDAPQCYWDLTDYITIVPVGSGLGESKQQAARKLADSAVAPLVAAARGIRAYTDVAEKKLLYEAIGLRDGRAAMARSLATCLDTSDVMTMPWYTIADIKAFHDRPHEGLPPAPFVQARPGHPWENKQGKPVKYLSVAGARTVIGTHPAHPMNFAVEPDVLLIAEGMLKADSALTGYLLDCGVPVESLAAPIDGNGGPLSQEEAIVRLRDLMTEYCDARGDDGQRLHKRILTISLVGVGTWHKNAPEWNQIPMRGVEAWVAFDADAAKNFQVWSQAKNLQSLLEKNDVSAVRFLVPAGEGAAEDKLGVDDYLAQVASFRTLTTTQLKDELPPQPEKKITTADVAQLDESLPLSAWRCDWEHGRMTTQEKHGEETITRVALPAAVRLAATRVRMPPRNREWAMPVIEHRVEIARGLDGTPERQVVRGAWISDEALGRSREVLRSASGDDIPMPHTNRSAVGELEQALRRSERPRITSYRETGWTDTREGLRFALPEASIGADGLDESIVATIDPKIDARTRIRPGNTETALRALAAALGTLTPVGKGVYLMSVCDQIAAMTGARPHGVFSVTGSAGSGKTQTLMAAVMHGRAWAPRHHAVMIEAGSTARSVSDAGAGVSDLVYVLDDLRQPDPDNGATVAGAAGIDTLARRGYQGGEAGRTRKVLDPATGEHINVAADPASPLIQWTSEVPALEFVPGSIGFRSRIDEVGMPRGTATDGGAALDAVCADGHLEAIAYAIISDLAQRYDDEATLRAAAEKDVSGWAAGLQLDSRPAHRLAYRRHGAAVLMTLAQAHGVELKEDIAAAEDLWMDAAEATHREIRTRARSAGIEYIRQLKDMLASGEAYLVGVDGLDNASDTERSLMVGTTLDNGDVALLSSAVAKAVRARSSTAVAQALGKIRGAKTSVTVSIRFVKRARATVIPRDIWDNEEEAAE